MISVFYSGAAADAGSFEPARSGMRRWSNVQSLILSAPDLSTRDISAECWRLQSMAIPARRNELTMFEGVKALISHNRFDHLPGL
jgi:hypothetical protein